MSPGLTRDRFRGRFPKIFFDLDQFGRLVPEELIIVSASAGYVIIPEEVFFLKQAPEISKSCTG